MQLTKPDTGLNRRTFINGIASCSLASMLPVHVLEQQSVRTDHYAKGTKAGVCSTSLQASEAALWALDQGGNAADAYIAAALTQTVSEPGLTSLGGAFGMQYFDAANAGTSYVAGLLGPAAAEPYDFDRQSPVTQTGRAMPVPGFLAGVHQAHRRHGRLAWDKLFQPAIRHATEGFLVNPKIIAAAQRKALKDPQSKKLWIRNGRLLKSKEPLFQPDAGKLLSSIAQDGPAAFYSGEFAKSYVKRAQADGGKITRKDMEDWRSRIKSPEQTPRGDYRGHQVVSAPLLVYALHLNEALDLRASGSAATSADSVRKQLRIMEEVFLSAKTLTKENEDQFVDPDYARKRADFVVNSPRRAFTLDAIFNTCFLVVRDQAGNCAWGTHSINSPTAFGAGIMVNGVYASYVINRGHVHGSGATAPGISTSYALYRNGKPRLIVGSPGYGFVHGPYQFGTGVVEWDLSVTDAMNLPRFSLPNAMGEFGCERHYGPEVLEMLKEHDFSHQIIPPSSRTGIVGALLVDDRKQLHFAQDGRRSGFAKSK